MNIDFAADATFSSYVLLLMFSGIVMIVLASPKVRSSVWLRILNVVVGLGFFGYGFYLTFLWDGHGTYFMFFKAFILPAALVFRTIQGAIASRRSAPATTVTPASEQPQPQPQI